MIGRPVPPRLEGRHVTLRPYAAGFSEDELQALYAWARDAELLSLTGGLPLDLPYARFREIFLEKIARTDASRELLYALLDGSGRLLGRVGLFGIDPDSRSAELGVVIGEAEQWGRGYGREAVGLLADHAFDVLGLRRITLYTYPDNLRAQRAFKAAGFLEMRRLRRFSLDRGTHDEVEMQLRPAGRARVKALAQDAARGAGEPRSKA